MNPHPFLRDITAITWPRAPKPEDEARAALLALRRALASAHQLPSVSGPMAVLSRIYAIRDDEVHQP